MKTFFKTIIIIPIAVVGLVFLAECICCFTVKLPEQREQSNKTFDYEYVTTLGERLTRQKGNIKLQMHPYLMYLHEPNQKAPIFNINSLGFRGEELSVRKENTFRVLLMGGSAVFGFVPSERETIAAHLESVLSQIYPQLDIEVINGGVLGYNMTQESLFYLLKASSEIKPDLVVAYSGWNDFYIPCFGSQRLSYFQRFPNTINYQPNYFHLENEFSKAANQSEDIQASFTSLLRAGSYRSHLCYVIYKYWNQHYTQAQYKKASFNDYPIKFKANQWHQRVINNFGNNLENYINVVCGSDVPLLFALQVELFSKKGPTPNEVRLRKKTEAQYRGYEKTVKKVYNQFSEVLKETAKETSYSNLFSYIDVKESFDMTDREAFQDFAHCNSQGNAVIALEIARYIKSNKMIAKP